MEKQKICIVISGGVLDSVFSNSNLEVELIDFDNEVSDLAQENYDKMRQELKNRIY